MYVIVIYIPDMYDPCCSHCRLSLVVSVTHSKSHDDTHVHAFTPGCNSLCFAFGFWCVPLLYKSHTLPSFSEKGLHIAGDKYHIWVQLSKHGSLCHLSVPFMLFMFQICTVKNLLRSLRLSLSWKKLCSHIWASWVSL